MHMYVQMYTGRHKYLFNINAGMKVLLGERFRDHIQNFNAYYRF